MSLLDFVLGRAPEYDADADPLAQPDPREFKDPAFHVRQDQRRYAAVMHTVSVNTIETAAIRRLLVAIIFLLVANKVIDLSFLTGLLQP